MPEHDLDKTQESELRSAAEQPPGTIISPDTLRAQRVPPGQSRTRKWPVLDASGPPRIDLAQWSLEIRGLVERPVRLDWRQFQELPRTRVFSDFHCVTRWSRLGNVWEGASVRDLMQLAGNVSPEARFALVGAYDMGWTTNLPLEMLLAEDSLVATHHDGEPLQLEHGGPARLLVPRLYAWKSAKWVASIELLWDDRAGFWEQNGYHLRGDPWTEERFRD